RGLLKDYENLSDRNKYGIDKTGTKDYMIKLENDYPGIEKAAKSKVELTSKPSKPIARPILGEDLTKVKESKFAKGITKSKEISPELQKSVKDTTATYTPLKNVDQIKASKDLVKKGYKKAASDVT